MTDSRTQSPLLLVSDSLRPSNRVSGLRLAALGKLGLPGLLDGTVTTPFRLIGGLVFGLSSSRCPNKKRPAGADLICRTCQHGCLVGC